MRDQPFRGLISRRRLVGWAAGGLATGMLPLAGRADDDDDSDDDRSTSGVLALARTGIANRNSYEIAGAPRTTSSNRIASAGIAASIAQVSNANEATRSVSRRAPRPAWSATEGDSMFSGLAITGSSTRAGSLSAMAGK